MSTQFLILGDSTSMAAGCEAASYPFHLAGSACWHADTTFVNCSLPGITSLDACAFYFRNKPDLPALQGVVVYLGNCDAMTSELRRGRYRPWRDKLMRGWYALRGRQRTAALKNRLLYFEWNHSLDASIEKPLDPKDFAANIARIAADCAHRNIPVVLIRPMAHRDFPAGVGKGNFLFYHYLDLPASFAGKLRIPDPRFIEAVRAFDAADFYAAATTYKKILLNPGPLSSNLEFQTLVSHNYAIARARHGDLAEAATVLSLLLKERGARREIILYNLASVERLLGNEGKAIRLFDETFESDASMYRVREEYLEAIDDVTRNHPNVRVVDMREFATEDDFVDHCHLLRTGQEELARRVRDLLAPREPAGSFPAALENRLTNPEYGLGISREFHDYFQTYAPLSSTEITELAAGLADRFAGAGSVNAERAILESVEPNIAQALRYIVQHPAFPSYRHIMAAGFSEPSDVGRFPEFFIIRTMIPFLRELEADAYLSATFYANDCGLRRATELEQILPEGTRAAVAPAPVVPPDEQAAAWCDAILQKTTMALSDHLCAGNMVHQRLLTTIYWYFREVLRFGSHSRHSMRYERVRLEYMAEALALSAVIDRRLGRKRQQRIKSLCQCLAETVSVHEEFVPDLAALKAKGGARFKEYDAALLRIDATLRGKRNQVTS